VEWRESTRRRWQGAERWTVRCRGAASRHCSTLRVVGVARSFLLHRRFCNQAYFSAGLLGEVENVSDNAISRIAIGANVNFALARLPEFLAKLRRQIIDVDRSGFALRAQI